MAKPAFERSSGNVFADLGMPQPEEHKLKAALVAKLTDIIDERGLTQTAASSLTGISQPDLSRVLRGRFRDFSVDRLIRAITHLDSEVEITVRHQGREVGEPIHVHMWSAISAAAVVAIAMKDCAVRFRLTWFTVCSKTR